MEKWFSGELIKWYQKHKRDLPWRNEKDAYRIWLSEIILQQTQVVQGLAYYYKFTQKYPDIKQLAKANEDEVLKLWQGLGYYSRARNLLFTAQTVTKEHKGVFPQNYLEIRNLKGIGDYTAAAIASFAFDLPHAVVDGNVYRLLSRVFGIWEPIDSTQGKKQFFELANQLLDPKKAAIHNQSIMEFGSQYCKPVKPDCPNCVLKEKCFAFKHGKVGELPVKSKKTKVKKRHFNYLVIANGKGDVLIRRREKNDIWKGLYEFEMIETDKPVADAKLFGSSEFMELVGKDFSVRHVSKTYKHILSHQILMAKFYVIELSKLKERTGTTKTNLKKLDGFAFPRLIEKFLHDCDLKEMLYF
jgi:A/G-specific adenine glycosylase